MNALKRNDAPKNKIGTIAHGKRIDGLKLEVVAVVLGRAGVKGDGVVGHYRLDVRERIGGLSRRKARSVAGLRAVWRRDPSKS